VVYDCLVDACDLQYCYLVDQLTRVFHVFIVLDDRCSSILTDVLLGCVASRPVVGCLLTLATPHGQRQLLCFGFRRLVTANL